MPGESPEDVASAARTTVETIMGFATPVLAERAHVARTAQKASVRRRTGESGAGLAHPRRVGRDVLPPSTRCTTRTSPGTPGARPTAGGRWWPTTPSGGRPRRAEFTHDLPGPLRRRRERRGPPADRRAGRAATGPRRAPRPRGAGSPRCPHQDELPLGDDAIELVRDRARVTADADWIAADGAAPVDEPLRGHQRPTRRRSRPSEPPAARGGRHRARRSRRKGRSSIPSWDEIMFGGQSE